MATPRELASYLGGEFGISGSTMLQIDRQLAEAGYRGSFGRGSSARAATAEDAVNLIVAAAAAPIFGKGIALAVAVVERFTSLPTEDRILAERSIHEITALPLVSSLPDDHTFGAALAALIEDTVNGDFPDDWRVEVGFRQPWPAAEIELSVGHRRFSAAYRRPWPGDDQSGFRIWAAQQAKEYGTPDLRQRRYVTERTIRSVADLLRREGG